VLEKYGFGPNFRKAFKILYTDITARIMVNGYFSESIRIERGVKQGDALSCAIFILCVDPLLRNLNKNDKIKGITLKLKRSNLSFQHKSSGYADDISIICKDTQGSLEAIFEEYQRLTKLSGLELNADKTEILRLTSIEGKSYSFKYQGKIHKIKNVSKLKICGIYFSSESEIESEHNVNDKIKKLECKLKPWIKRGLSLEGKILLVKTFGISQLIYNMQCVNFTEDKILEIERKIFSFIWSKRTLEVNSKSIDRIKRSVLKNDYLEGGLKATDVESLNKALKLRQYIRSNKVEHVISKIQKKCLSDNNNYNNLQQDFGKIGNEEVIVNTALETIHNIIDYNRKLIKDKVENSDIGNETVNQVSSINVANYLRRTEKVLALCIFNNTFKDLETLLDLTREAETEVDRRRSKMLEMILSNFPKEFRQLALSFDDNSNSICTELVEIETGEGCWMRLEDMTTKSFQSTLKHALGKITTLNVKQKTGISTFDMNNFLKIRQNCKNTRMRATYYRLTNNDFFSNDRMFRFKMSQDNNCPRCHGIETTKHMLWECHESAIIWKILNHTLDEIGLADEKISLYEDIYNITNNIPITHVKMKIIQEMIQITRPTNWNKAKIVETFHTVANMEKYIAVKNNKLTSWQNKWSILKRLKEYTN
jgi:hypothetical protein